MPEGFTYLDIALVALALISGLLAMYRGLTREVLSIVSWALAGAAVLYFILFHKDSAQGIADQFFGGTLIIALVAIGSVIFILVLVFVHLLTVRFSDSVLDSQVGMIDRVLGFGFGVVRGFLLIVILYVFFDYIVDKKFYPEWVVNAQSRPYIEDTGNAIKSVIEPYLPIGGTAAEPGTTAPEGTGTEGEAASGTSG